ncbi:MAG: ATP-dependent RNA helicase [Spirochaetia bacterium]|jgi:RNA helicase HrpA|nr:ATP-dependent RNA helicase [Spirochaetia bacterium]
MEPHKLPVYQEKERILKVLSENQVIVIESPTGSGKTTQLPLILHEAGYSAKGVIGVTQPRRIATLSVSDYIAKQLDTKIPGIVGYKMRFNDMTSRETTIKIMTDGILLQEIKTDLLLTKYSCIIVDEAHERSLNIDFIMGLLKKVIEVRPDFKVIISSATINTSVFAEYFGHCPVVHIDSIIYPVGIVYDPVVNTNDRDAVIYKIKNTIERIISEKREGDILVFLSGERQIKDCITLLNSSQYRKKMVILPLYGRLSKEEQERVFIPTPSGKTKIVVATNIAETSVTIDRITSVIDSGLAKINSYNPKTFTSALIETTIAKASCNQRKGRAGRTLPGTCYRLYTKNDYESRPLFTKEEIYRTDLSEVVLRMAELGIKDFESFDFISSPGKQGIAGAVETLKLLGAINNDNSLTKIGEMMAFFPLLPRLSRIIVEAILNSPDVLEETILAATFLSTNSPFLFPQGEEFEARKAHQALKDPDGDFVSYIKIYRSFMKTQDKESFCKKNYIDVIMMEELVNIKKQLEEIVSDMGIPITSGGRISDYLIAVSKGLVQFVCVRSGRSIYRSLTAEKIQIHPGSVMFKEDPPFIVAGEIVRTIKMFAHSVSPLKKEWLNQISPDLFRDFTELKKSDILRDKKKDTTNFVKIGNESFRLDFVKGKKRKNAYIELGKAKELIKTQGLKNLYIPHGITGTLIYNNFEILSGEKLTNIFRIVPYIETDLIAGKNKLPRGNINISTGADKIMENLQLVLSLSQLKNKSRQLGFISLNTDNRGNYWFKTVKSFDLALTASLESLVEFMDAIPDDMEKYKIEKINKIYRRLTEILEDQNSSID